MDDGNVIDFKTKQDTVLKVAEEIAELAPIVEAKTEGMPYTQRTNKAPHSLQLLAKDYTEEALDTLLEVLRNKQELGGVRIEAAKQILDRGWGKAAIKMDGTIKHVSVHVELKQLSDGVKDPPRLTEIIDVTSEEVVDGA